MNARDDAEWVGDTITQLQAENERMRVALIQILDDPEMTGAEAKAIATAALSAA